MTDARCHEEWAARSPTLDSCRAYVSLTVAVFDPRLHVHDKNSAAPQVKVYLPRRASLSDRTQLRFGVYIALSFLRSSAISLV